MNILPSTDPEENTSHLSASRRLTSLQDLKNRGISPEVMFEFLKNVAIFLARQNTELTAPLKVTERRLLLARQTIDLRDDRGGVLQ